ncbi:peptide chain release factor 1 [Cardinium endosymbiont of Culicoides punctatus]|uniref:peptide chain release factor 1 n=1 Tax=Cardinium endosymbiont of Culicoides punctatus TaxID=2304601 RepID=UPI001058C340|nr:peptide chain release factor 1 [Cardinium endosymbiont of Culicoides punctatus]TDG95498.1 Peptide chain release factor 1 [Cardinium endosymbiont of Culicoides punctatus]
MVEKLKIIKERFQEVEASIAQPDSINDIKAYSVLNKEYKKLAKIVSLYDSYELTLNHIKEAKEVLNNEKEEEFRELAKQELAVALEKKDEMEEALRNALIPNDPNDSKNIILEIRAGIGGDEAAIFTGDLFRMYKRFAEKMKWDFAVVDILEGTSGGYKEIICTITGEDVYGLMKYESGVHRVQRVPATETQGRIHTSAASVAVLLEAEDVEVKLDVNNDIRKDTFCSSGPGGQSVNTTYSAIRLTHIPTGLVVSCQDEKSQIKNYEKALKVLRSRLYDIELKKQQEAIGMERKSMVKSGNRGDKIRTYNFPQGRATDHRIGYTAHNLNAILDGEILGMIEALRVADNAQKLQAGEILDGQS